MMSSFNRNVARAALLASAALLPTVAWAQTQPADPAAPATTDAATADDQQDVIVVTGTTSRDRPLITASADITARSERSISAMWP